MCSLSNNSATALSGFLYFVCGLWLDLASPLTAQDAPPNRFEQAIRAYELQDQTSPPKLDGILFVGSSSIRLWNLESSFPNLGYINRGFGGSQIADSVFFAKRIILPYRPRVIVVYAGDNDIAAGKSPNQVAADFDRLVAAIHGTLPTTKVIYISIKSSLKRWALRDKIREANAKIQRACELDSRLKFVDVFDAMLGDDKTPRSELFVQDGLHLSPVGYQLWTALLSPHLATAKDQVADRILHNGKIVTVDQQFSLATAVAIKGDRILAVGNDETILKLRGPSTDVHDLAGKTVLPGLIDSHTHPDSSAMHEFDHPVPDMETIDDVLAYVKSRVAAVPEGTWIWVNQIFITRLKEQRYPTKAELDAIAPRHPIVFSTGPDAMTNSLALALSGIDKDFVVTGSGFIEKDTKTGEPTGMLRGGTKRYLKSQSAGTRATEKQRLERLAWLFADYNSVGITSIADRDASASEIEQYRKMLAASGLTVRIAASHSLDAAGRVESIQDKIREIAQHPLREKNYKLRIVGTKSYLDGGMLTGSAFMRQPWGVSQIYSITDPEYRGVLFIPPEKLTTIVRTAVEHGLQFTAHSVGDGAVHTLLAAYKEVNRTIPVAATRPCLTHSNFMSAEAIELMAKLGVVADIQPAWLYLDARTLTAQFGYERLQYFQPLRSIFAAGVIAGGGSDHMQKIGSLRSINPYNPWLAMATTITRRAKWYEGSLHPEQALSREQAIRFYTTNNSYILFLDDQVGSLEAGKLADLIVIDRDVLTCPDTDIQDTRVLQTYLGGQRVFP